MFRRVAISLIILSVIICCMGQTFQYSRGWTNGKRSNSHLFEDSVLPEIMEMDMQRKLEKCLISLQRISRPPFNIRGSLIGNIRPGLTTDRHQSNEILDDFTGDQVNLIKGQA